MSIKNSIIIQPILSEKSNLLGEIHNKYVFKVQKSANKLEIKEAIENKFNIKVKKVAIINVNGKLKNTTVRSNGRVLRTSGYRSGWKKAIVSLKEGFTLDLLGGDI
tara:strand:+ start:1422 stop:1739 length:318 start_codon:yes stop_codon:yes gene_type:complete